MDQPPERERRIRELERRFRSAGLPLLAEDYSATQGRARRFEAPNSNITPPITGDYAWLILPGQSFAMTLDTNAEADSGAVVSFVEYIDAPFAGTARLVNMTRDTSNDIT